MEFNFTRTRLALFILCLAGFAWFGGFTPPELSGGSVRRPPQVERAWLYCVLMFIGGSASVSVIDHWVGNLDRTNIRPAYIVLGLFLMAGAVVWLRAVKQTLADIG